MLGEQVGNYRIVRTLGKGGMGVVYVAEHTLMGKQAAVKTLLPHHSENREIVRRFFVEAKAATRISHPSIVDVYDFGYHDSGVAYIVMELLSGCSLQELLKKEPQLDYERLRVVSWQLAHGLAAAHSEGIVHRDLKPDNVFLINDAMSPGGERVKILDFGIAKLSEQAGRISLRTQTGALMGTPTYMAPEQCRGAAEVDARADIYSLGCMMYEMACGRPPFRYQGLGEMLSAHMNETPPPLRAIEPGVPAPLEAIVLRALLKDPDRRFQSMNELADALAAVGSGDSKFGSSSSGTRLPVTKLVDVQIDPFASTVDPGEQRPTTTLSSAASHSLGPSSSSSRSGGAVRTYAAAVAVLLLGSIATYFGLSGGGGEDLSSTEPSLAAARGLEPDAAAATPDQSAAPEVDAGARFVSTPIVSKKVRVEITSEPAGAWVTRASDGKRLGKTPLDVEWDRSDEAVTVVLRRRKYRDETLTVPLSSDFRRHVSMEKISRRKRVGERADSTAGSASTPREPQPQPSTTDRRDTVTSPALPPAEKEPEPAPAPAQPKADKKQPEAPKREMFQPIDLTQ